jgi:serine phosphatase RsbU (regulator of sigma subunit)
LPLGVTPDTECCETAFMLERGQTLAFLSDGVVEAQNKEGELFGFERACAISGQTAQQIADAAQRFGQEDDITILTLSFAPAEVIYS